MAATRNNSSAPPVDRRVRRTQATLQRALIGLVGDVGDSDLGEVPFLDEVDEGALQGGLGAPHAPVDRRGAAVLHGRRHGPEPTTFSYTRRNAYMHMFSTIS